jgi:hypothetical protein
VVTLLWPKIRQRKYTDRIIWKADPAHRYKLFNKTNSEILAIAEHIYGHPLPKEAGLPQIICRPCERRLRSFSAFKNTIVQTQSTLTKFKRCNKDSPGVSRVSKSLKSAQEPPQKQSQRARQRLCFMQSSHGKEVSFIAFT